MTVEDNKKIAEFMGYVSTNLMAYNWNELMKVVDKIESEGTGHDQYTISMYYDRVIIFDNDTFEEIVTTEGFDRKDTLYRAVVAFIKNRTTTTITLSQSAVSMSFEECGLELLSELKITHVHGATYSFSFTIGDVYYSGEVELSRDDSPAEIEWDYNNLTESDCPDECEVIEPILEDAVARAYAERFLRD